MFVCRIYYLYSFSFRVFAVLSPTLLWLKAHVLQDLPITPSSVLIGFILFYFSHHYLYIIKHAIYLIHIA
jgi:hypothetical protein